MAINAEYFKRHTYTPQSFYDYMTTIENAMSGDIEVEIDPETLGNSAAAIAAAIAAADDDKFIQAIDATVVDGDGNTLTWFNGTLPVATSATTAGDGDTAIEDSATTITFVNGVGTVNIEYTDTWADDDTNEVTISASDAGEIMGYAITEVTSTDTVVA